MNWIHRLFNPHCPHCKEEQEESKVCQSCEQLKSLLEQSNYERKELLAKLLNKMDPTSVPPVLNDDDEERKQPLRKNIPWNVRRQMLEAEDREKARSMRNAAKPDKPTIITTDSSVDELEKEIGIS